MKKPEVKQIFTLNLLGDDLYEQAEHLMIYYVARLKALKAQNDYKFITYDQADEETFYKDIISACMGLLVNKEEKIRKDERNNKESRELPPGLFAE